MQKMKSSALRAALAVTLITPFAVQAVTAGPGTWSSQQAVAATCYTSSNYVHVQAGRAYDSGGYAYVNGSNQKMGLDNTFYTSTLKKTGTNYYVIGTCS